jgi:UDP-glucose 6-dehydrogenase
MKERIVVIGFGWVGQANAIALSKAGYRVFYYDPAEPLHHHERYAEEYRKITRLKGPLDVDGEDACYIVAVSDRVLEDGVQDLSAISKALQALKGAKGAVVLRSTVLPGRLRELLFDFYMPEFLHEKQAVEDCLEPYLFVVGERSQKPEPSFFSLWRGKSYKSFAGTPEEASYVKYLSNLWNAMRIAFTNEFGDAMGVPSTKNDLASIERVQNFLFDHRPYMRYGKAFKGHCLPKDSRAFIRWHADRGAEVSLLKGMYDSNAVHEAAEAQHPVLQEWYSSWPDRHISAKTALGALAHSLLKRLKFLK